MPNEQGKGFVFKNLLKAEVVPKEFHAAIESGVTSALSRGVIAGYPIIDIKVEVYDGSFSPTDSDEVSFQIAASTAFSDAVKAADPVLLEPVMDVEVMTPAENMGSVVGDINARRGNIKGMNQRGVLQVVDAEVPLERMFGYVDSLRSISAGRANYSMQFGKYAPIPLNVLAPLLKRIRGY